jgi:hypothetical protein
MTGPPNHKPRDKPPPRREEGAPARAPTPTADGRQHGWVQRTEPDQGVNTEAELRPRPWPHDRRSCSTCETYAALTDRRRRAEIAGLKAARRIVDLQSEEDVAWVRAHVHAHRDWQSYRETGQ